MSLRKEKSARLKVQLAEQMLKMVGKKAFEDLHVEDLCTRVKISKVTFFKYFPQKEDLLVYYLRIWCLERSVEMHDKPREGTAALYYLADKLSETCETYPGLMLALVGYLCDFKRTPKPFPLKVEEKQLLYHDREDMETMEIMSIEQMIEKAVLESIFKKEITKTNSTREVTHLLTATLLGSVLAAHLNQQSSLKLLLHKNVELIMKGLQ